MENKVKVWLARDKNGKLYAYSERPNKMVTYRWVDRGFNSFELDCTKIPSVKWEDDKPTAFYTTLDEPQPKQPIDWEQRRYEIAKEMMPVLYRQGVEVLKYGQSFEWKGIVDGAVNFADMLIEKLKKGGER